MPHFHNDNMIYDQHYEHFSLKIESDKYEATVVIKGVIQETLPGKTVLGTRNSRVKWFILGNQNVSRVNFPTKTIFRTPMNNAVGNSRRIV